ncbi:MAG: hypothetical protein F6J97_09570 [Leptolyngbya sp. SIO4C1]|nr:hypothetical protein [Leptolyngbya sp. SIO4C1]
MADNYLVAVLSDRMQVEAAYSALENEALPMEQISILGRGYQSADEFGLINPDEAADQQSNQLAYWVIPFGFAAGFAFSVLSGLQTFAWAGELGNHIVGGLLGAASGGLGAFVVGRIVGWTVGSGDAIAYRNRLNRGKYLIIAEGTDELIRQATRVLRQYEPENIQGYSAQGAAG